MLIILGVGIIPILNLTPLKTHSGASRFNNFFLLTTLSILSTKIFKIPENHRKQNNKIPKTFKNRGIEPPPILFLIFSVTLSQKISARMRNCVAG